MWGVAELGGRGSDAILGGARKEGKGVEPSLRATVQGGLPVGIRRERARSFFIPGGRADGVGT